MPYQQIQYDDLNPRQQENYNYHKASAVLADYGFTTIRLNDDWHGADFIALHIDGVTSLMVQLKGRASFAQNYLNRNLHICFPEEGTRNFYLYPHNQILEAVFALGHIQHTNAWIQGGNFHFPTVPEWLENLLEEYRVVTVQD